MRRVHFSFSEYIPNEKENCKTTFDGCNSNLSGYSKFLAEGRLFNLITLVIIISNTLLLALQSIPDLKARIGWYISLSDCVFLSYYVVEIVIKFLAFRLNFFRYIWNIFDLIIVLAANVEFLVLVVTMYIQIIGSEIFHIFSFLRALKATRAIRALRAIRFLRKLQIIVTTVLRSVPAFSSLFLLIGLVAFNFAVVGRGFYGNIAPKYFGNIFRSIVTSFQLLTLDDWASIFHSVIEKNPNRTLDLYIYIILYMGTETFIFINLFVAVIVDNLSKAQRSALEEKSGVEIHAYNPFICQNSNEMSYIINPNYSSKIFFNVKNSNPMEENFVKLVLQILAGIEASHFTIQGQHETMSLLVDLVDFTQSPNSAHFNPKFFN